MIIFKDVTKQYPDGMVAVNNLSLTISEGKLVSLVGPSGCGKTTTMKLINKLIPLSSGTITINGEDISKEDDVILRRNIGYVIQRIGLLPHMTIEENVSLVPKLKGWKKVDYERKVNDLLDLVGLDPSTYKKKYPLELSGGQQQRVGVIRALAGEPPIILMDEPFSALDPISREQLQAELKLIQKNIHKTIVFVTHDMDEALKISDEIVVMKSGYIQQIATPEQLVQSPANNFVRSFIGEDRVKQGEQSISEQKAYHFMKALNQAQINTFPSLSYDSTLQEVAHLMLQQEAGAVILMGKDNTPKGIIEKDQLLKELAGIKGGES